MYNALLTLCEIGTLNSAAEMVFICSCELHTFAKTFNIILSFPIVCGVHVYVCVFVCFEKHMWHIRKRAGIIEDPLNGSAFLPMLFFFAHFAKIINPNGFHFIFVQSICWLSVCCCYYCCHRFILHPYRHHLNNQLQ